MSLIPIIQYRDFWDVPRIFLVYSKSGNMILFDCRFNLESEDYEDMYQVFDMGPNCDFDLSGSWDKIADSAITYLGEIPVSQLIFDESMRRFVDDSSISGIL